MKRVMVVEDEPFIRETLKEALEFEGYEVMTAQNGRDALDCLARASTKPDLILLDLLMPVMTGSEFLGCIAESGELTQIPVVVVSATPEFSSSAEGTVREYVKKPLDLERLLNLVAKYTQSTH